jgi:hypothetical protein
VNSLFYVMVVHFVCESLIECCYATCSFFVFVTSVVLLWVGLYPVLHYQVLYQNALTKKQDPSLLEQTHKNIVYSGIWFWFWLSISFIGLAFGFSGTLCTFCL